MWKTNQKDKLISATRPPVSLLYWLSSGLWWLLLWAFRGYEAAIMTWIHISSNCKRSKTSQSRGALKCKQQSNQRPKEEWSTSAAGQKEHHQLWGVQQPVIVHSVISIRWDSDGLRGFRHVPLIDTCTERCYRLSRQPVLFNTLTDTHQSTRNGLARGRNLCSLIPMQMFCLVQVTVGYKGPSLKSLDGWKERKWNLKSFRVQTQRQDVIRLVSHLNSNPDPSRLYWRSREVKINSSL